MKKSCIIAIGLILVTFMGILSGCSNSATTTIPANTTQAPSAVIPIAVPPTAAVSSPGSAAPNIGVSVPAVSNYVSQPSLIQPGAGQTQSNGIWVTGQGQVSAVPDIASLNLGVNSQATTVAGAQSAAVNSMNAMMQVLKNKGVADKDITTTGYNIYPNMDYKINKITSYQVNNSIVAKIRALADVGSIIDGVVAAGGNLIVISSISFSIDDPSPYLKQARQLAVADAQAKAVQLATASGVKLGSPSFITETSGNYTPATQYLNAVAAVPAASTSINPGTSQISVNVQIVYNIQ